MKIDDTHTAAIMALSASIMAQLRREGRFPARLDEEDYDDILQDGTLAALTLFSRFDPDRGSLRAFMYRAMARAMLDCAWHQAQVGITGHHGALQVWSTDANDADVAALDLPMSDDVAAEIEAFDHVWRSHYIKST